MLPAGSRTGVQHGTRAGLTSGFGKRPGVSLPLWPSTEKGKKRGYINIFRGLLEMYYQPSGGIFVFAKYSNLKFVFEPTFLPGIGINLAERNLFSFAAKEPMSSKRW